MKLDPTRESIAVMIKGRYFTKFGKKGQVYTSSKLHSAALYPGTESVPSDRLVEKGKSIRLLHVKVHPILTQYCKISG